jgi:low temperature requirement protein LtrA
MTSGGAPPPSRPPPRPRPRPDRHEPDPGTPLRVTTIELFFDLVFAFTLTQLTELLDVHALPAGAVQVLLIFALIWWMYAGYAWLTNARPPVTAAERLPLLTGMGGLLIAGLAIPQGFGPGGAVLGLGYLVVVLVHAYLYRQVNRNIIRIAPFSVASALLVIVAGLVSRHHGAPRPVVYVLWAVAVAVQLGSPLVVTPRGRFGLHPAHIVERHTALVIVALGESVAAVGIGAGHLASEAGMSVRLVGVALLGLALCAALWWALFGGGEDERAERALTAADRTRRTGVVLNAYFYAYTPLLLGIVAVAAGLEQAIAPAADPPAAEPAGAAVLLAVGTAGVLAGDIAFRRLLGLGNGLARPAAAAAALATIPAGLYAGMPVQLALLAAVLTAMLVIEQRARREPPGVAAG